MRSPDAAFDLRAALIQELNAARDELDSPTARPRAVHRCRVRLKRARALARVGRVGAPGLASVFNDSARAVMKQLAQARDLTALSETARAAAKNAPKKSKRALQTTAERLEQARAALPQLDLAAVHARLRELQALAQVWPDASPRQIHKGAKRIARRARRARQASSGQSAAPKRHEWRKREKDRYFASLLLDDTWPRKRRKNISEKLGHVLGEERDVLLLLDQIKANPMLAGGKGKRKRALSLLRRHRAKFAKRADALGDKLHAGGA